MVERHYGRSYDVIRQPNYPDDGFDSLQKQRGDHVACYLNRRDYWTYPVYDRTYGRSEEELRIGWERAKAELGGFFDEIWRTLALDWYRGCDDPMFVVRWIESRFVVRPITDCKLAVLCHMAGENGNARVYLQRRVDEAAITYEELYRRMHKDRRGSWLRRLWGESRWSEEKVAKHSRADFRILSEGAEAARKLAGGFGIKLD